MNPLVFFLRCHSEPDFDILHVQSTYPIDSFIGQCFFNYLSRLNINIPYMANKKPRVSW